MNYLFDTSILISIQKGHPTILEKLYTLSVNSDLPPAITTFSYAEFFLGILGGSESKRKPHIDFLTRFPTFTLTPTSARIWAELSQKYRTKGKRIPDIDLFIAAITIEQGRCLISKDKDFQSVEELQKIILN